MRPLDAAANCARARSRTVLVAPEAAPALFAFGSDGLDAQAVILAGAGKNAR
jgi:hypothetical protein